MASLPYLPHTDADVRAMLDKAGVKSLQDLYSDVPAKFLKKAPPGLYPEGH